MRADPTQPARAREARGLVSAEKTGVTTVTTGFTFLPLNRIGKTTTFTVVPPVP